MNSAADSGEQVQPRCHTGVAGLIVLSALLFGGCESKSPVEPEPLSDGATSTEAPLCLELVTARNEVLLGEPLSLLVRLRNCSDNSQTVRDLLNVEYGLLVVTIGHPEHEEDSYYDPPVRRDGRGKGELQLDPGENISAEVQVYFGHGGWQLKTPGTYTFVAEYAADEIPLRSNSLSVEVGIPLSDADRSAANAMMSDAAATFYFMGGGDATAAAELQAIADNWPESVWAGYARFGLALDSAGVAAASELKTQCRVLEDLLVDLRHDWVTARRGLRALTHCLEDADQQAEIPRVTAEFAARHPEAS